MRRFSGAKAADSPEAIINNLEIDVVCVFVPPFVRKEYVLAAAKAGKQIVATKPLAADLSDSTGNDRGGGAGGGAVWCDLSQNQ